MTTRKRISEHWTGEFHIDEPSMSVRSSSTRSNKTHTSAARVSRSMYPDGSDNEHSNEASEESGTHGNDASDTVNANEASKKDKLDHYARRFTGSCQCGDLSYECHEFPKFIHRCFCLACRKQSGGPYMIYATVNGAKFKDTTSKAKRRKWKQAKEIHHSRFSCSRCRSPIYRQWVHKNGEIEICVSSIDNFEELVEENKKCWLQNDNHILAWLSERPSYCEKPKTRELTHQGQKPSIRTAINKHIQLMTAKERDRPHPVRFLRKLFWGPHPQYNL